MILRVIMTNKKIIIILIILLLPFLIIVEKEDTLIPIQDKQILTRMNTLCGLQYKGVNDIIILPIWKAGNFSKQDTIVLKIAVNDSYTLYNKYHIKITITKPDLTTILVDDYMFTAEDPHYQVELYLDQNGTWSISTYAEYKWVALFGRYRFWNDGSVSFNVSSIGLGPEESFQVVPITSTFVSPSFITIDELGSRQAFFNGRVKNQTHNKANAFVRYYIYDGDYALKYTDSGYTAVDGVFTSTIPTNTFDKVEDHLVEIHITYDSVEVANASGVVHVRYVIHPQIDVIFENATYQNVSAVYSGDILYVKWNWSLYKEEPDSVQYRIKIINNDSSIVLSQDFEVTVISNNQTILTSLGMIPFYAYNYDGVFDVILQSKNLLYNFELYIGNITIFMRSEHIVSPVDLFTLYLLFPQEPSLEAFYPIIIVGIIIGGVIGLFSLLLSHKKTSGKIKKGYTYRF